MLYLIVVMESDKLLARATDATLVAIFFGLDFVFSGAKNYPQMQRSGERALDHLADVNYEQIRRALYYLKRKGLVQYTRETIAQPRITAAGLRRLKGTIPFYDTQRVWDGVLYLITYDLPVKENHKRDTLRRFLKRLGAAALQESVWVTPYNPTELVRKFIEAKDIEGTILVSSIGKDGSIGGMELPKIIQKVYELNDLNSRYEGFILRYKGKKRFSKEELLNDFLSILEDDPQLPFALLPTDWVGDKAYKLFKKLAK